mgnify:FL=1|tara:strand:- start:144 stop:731 length:588 start_codon:yes stop_codon:yes gene_type:complete
MVICKKKKLNFIFSLFLILIFSNFSNADESFKKLENKKVSYLDFFLLKFENTIIKRAQILRRQLITTRVQYSNIGIQVDLDEKKEEILINIYAIMDKNRYQKKRYEQKLSDCNQVRNLIFYQKHGYKFFSQKRDPMLSQDVMEDIFKDVFFHNISFNNKETNFLMDKIFVKVTIFHPIKKKELSCYGKANDYELQ